MGSGGGKIEAPQPSAAEQQYYSLMNQDILKSRQMQSQLEPLVAQKMGLKAVSPAASPEDVARSQQLAAEIAQYDANPDVAWRQANQTAQQARLAEKQALDTKYAASYTKMGEDEYRASLGPTEQAAYDIQKLQADRQLKALRGELPVDLALEKNIADEWAKLSESMAQRLGSTWQQSTPGIQAIDAFNKRAELLRQAQRRDEMTTGQAAYLNTIGFLNNQQTNQASQYSNFANTPMSRMNAYGQALQPFQQYAQMGFQANMQNAQNKTARDVGLMSAIGNLAGTGAGLAGGYWLTKPTKPV